MDIQLIYSEKFLQYRDRGHPETPERLNAIINFLCKKGICNISEPVPCTEDELLLAHSQKLIDDIKKNTFFDPDTPNIENIYFYASLSCGAAIGAAQASLEGRIGFSAARPPGHHAGKDLPGGFCYFNNMAVAVKKISSEQNLKVAVLDIDGHHGNGTEEILKEQDGTLYASIHQYPAYPGTGSASFANCHNFPVYPGTSAKKYMEKFMKAIDVIGNFSPDMIGISAGFDGHTSDPLLELRLTDEDYYTMGRELSATGKKIFIVLEGGYNTRTIGNTSFCLLNGLIKEYA